MRNIHAIVPAALLPLTMMAAAGCGSSASSPASNAPAPAPMKPAATSFQPTVENTGPPHGERPAGMVWIPGGEFSMGAADMPAMDEVGMSATVDSRPIHRVYVDGFWMDETEVTNETTSGSPRPLATSRSPNADRASRTFLARPRKTWSLAPWCFRLPTMPCPSTITFDGGRTCGARTGATRKGRTAT